MFEKNKPSLPLDQCLSFAAGGKPLQQHAQFLHAVDAKLQQFDRDPGTVEFLRTGFGVERLSFPDLIVGEKAIPGVTFATQKVTRPVDFRDGTFRAGDEEIVAIVADKLLHAQGPVRVLELGCGSSYPGAAQNHFGAPWLSRAMSSAFLDSRHIFPDSSLEITISDIEHSLPQHSLEIESTLAKASLEYRPPRFKRIWDVPALEGFLVEGSGSVQRLRLSLVEIYRYGEPTRDGDRIAVSAAQLDGEGRFSFGPVPFREFQTYGGAFQRLVIDQVKASYRNGSPPGADANLFLRPALDDIYEAQQFGLKVVGGVQFHTAADMFAGQQFDVVFARHVPPEFKSDMDSIVAGLENLKAADGKMVFTLDAPDSDGKPYTTIQA